MNTKSKYKSIEFKTLIFVLIFNIGIVLFFWSCEQIFFNVFYKSYQTNNIKEAISEIKSSNEDLYVTAEKVAYSKEVCISIIDDDYLVYNFNTLKRGCELGNNNNRVKEKINEFISGNKDSKSYRFLLKNTKTESTTESLMYALKSKNKYVFVYNNISNNSKVYNLFNQQLIYFIIIVVLISFFVSIFVSKNITKPIKLITKKATKIGEGKYNNIFPKNGINEIDDLSNTLEEVQSKLVESDHLKRDLMANVGHDLKTPLTMIKAYAEMIKDISYKDKNKLNEHIDIITSETDRLTLLVNDIIELSKSQSDVLMFNIEKFDLVKVIKDIVKKYDVIKETEDYNIVTILPKKAIVRADKNKIIQVIYNLVNNAINYTGKDKLVTVKVTEVNKKYLVEVIDTGKGINKNELEYIWDKYYKNDKNHRRNVVSTGLGLSIVKEILSKHDFEYGVTSKKNHGSTFYFKIDTDISSK